MPRATSVLAAADRHGRPVIDTVILDYAQRSAQKITVTGVKGGAFEIDLQGPARLQTDDLLLLDDGGLVEVVAAPEPLIEARAARCRDRSLAQVARRESGDDRSAVRTGRRRLRVIAWA